MLIYELLRLTSSKIFDFNRALQEGGEYKIKSKYKYLNLRTLKLNNLFFNKSYADMAKDAKSFLGIKKDSLNDGKLIIKFNGIYKIICAN